MRQRKSVMRVAPSVMIRLRRQRERFNGVVPAAAFARVEEAAAQGLTAASFASKKTTGEARA
jgi:hypothetical protein